MATTVKLDTTAYAPVHFRTTHVEVTVNVIVKNRSWDVDCEYDLVTGKLIVERVGVYGSWQFANENGLTIEELNTKVAKAFKQGLKQLQQR